MQDQRIINQIEKVLGIQLEKKLIPSHMFDISSFTLNEDFQVIGLSLAGMKINNLEEIIPLIMELEHLIFLDLSNAGLTNIGPLKHLSHILSLDLSRNSISNIESIGSLTKIKCLNLSDNKISDVNPLAKCHQISILFLTNNNIKQASKSIFNFLFNAEALYSLNEMLFAKNCFIRLQSYENAAITRDYERYYTSRLNIEALFHNMAGFKFLKSLETTFIKGNPLANPPYEIIQQGSEAIKNYFIQIEKESGKTEYLFEAKLLVIGEGGTGKTSFIRKMHDLNSEMPQEKDTTLGIEVGKWSFDIDFPQLPELSNVKFHANLWDFGGQKIYQGTHQIFFSDKSFYVLLADAREQKTDFSYWLNTVEQLGGEDSSLIIVLNKKFGHEQKFDESGYKGHFGKIIKDVIELDLKSDKSKLHELQDKVKMYLKLLPGIGDPLPPSWVSIREDLLKEKLNFISFDRFRQICETYNITDKGMIHTISGYFNKIGAFTHYIDEPLLQERIYLNSNWLVKTVYEVLDNEISKSKKGRLTEKDIKQIWSNNELHYEVNKLTQLMHNFGLMYHIPKSDNYVVPAHLPTMAPYDKWQYSDSKNVLQFIYEFDKYMPQGIMSRLIVALNHHIKNHNLVWHRGVNLESEGAHAEIVESYGAINRFEIRITGLNKIELLAIIREHFAEVLKPFKNLKYKQQVPCICEECTDTNEPAFHEYNLLLKFREKGTGSQCSKTGNMVDAEELLKVTNTPLKPRDSMTEKNTGIETIKIFLACSSELEGDKKAFREFISLENDRLYKKGIYLELIQCENFIDAMSKEGLQSEYDLAAKESDIFVSLFFTKVGKYTSQEFEAAFGQFKDKGKPLIYTYFKDAHVSIDHIKKEDLDSKFEFEDKLKELKHYKTVYKDSNDLKIQFKMQLEKLLQKFGF